MYWIEAYRKEIVYLFGVDTDINKSILNVGAGIDFSSWRISINNYGIVKGNNQWGNIIIIIIIIITLINKYPPMNTKINEQKIWGETEYLHTPKVSPPRFLLYTKGISVTYSGKIHQKPP